MAEIHQFPLSRRVHNNRVAAEQSRRNELDKWLREIADLVRNGDLEVSPTAIALVLSGKTGDEIVWKGYQDNSDVCLRDVARAFNAQFNTPYTRRGGNFHDRRKK